MEFARCKLGITLGRRAQVGVLCFYPKGGAYLHRPGEGPTAHLHAVAGVPHRVSVTVARGRPLVISSQIGELLEGRAPTESQARRGVGVPGEAESGSRNLPGGTARLTRPLAWFPGARRSQV